ncbi:uncharacterized protein BYT42DRAFT_564559 [Radiomyces spectabilis]|uniref:uncharacterized protein n=1 Tax=Radiomyces spectabilis TaxID=64574 RepID=UPI00221F9D8F|nr:uncharacterized protein BYT42DRAFT_564559 [Radiomyces spectabilis]KAI8380882.1 hypothetical protein BYT42DRAFT_564559 [Radiomyces spectabilis]
MTDTDNLVRFDNQVAGHDRLLRFSTNDMIIVKPCTLKELAFYEASHRYPDFQEWIPECYGSLRASSDSELRLLNEQQQYENDVTQLPSELIVDPARHVENNLCLENVLRGFTKPCILDVKIGRKLCDETADEDKRKRMEERAKSTTTHSIALRICGMKTFNAVNGMQTIYSKTYGRSLVKDDILDGFLAYFFPSSDYAHKASKHSDVVAENVAEVATEGISARIPGKMMRWILESFQDDLSDMRDFIATHSNLQLISSSLLFVYEGDQKAAESVWKRMLQEDEQAEQTSSVPVTDDDNEEDEEDVSKICDVRLIDFAHSKWDASQEQQDPGLLEGFDNMIGILQECIRRQRAQKL